ncbi:MAG: leucine-rich repeat protein [Erysipelotrichaceae bacterium]|jgi:hypothetical protein|nr:leucine-rich repeat protein [Erysipelotrichaceae bacterium]
MFANFLQPVIATQTYTAGDFTVSGTAITGFSSDGLDKYNQPDGKEITIPAIASVDSIAASAFADYAITSLTISEGYTAIGAHAFQNNQISTLSLPSTLTTIDEYAFANNKLTSLNLATTGVSEIAVAAFRDNQLSTLTTPASLHTIKDYAFFNNSLTSLNVDNHITTLGAQAFGNNRFTALTLDYLTTIDTSAFAANGQVVAITTSQSGLSSSYNNGDGYIINPITITIHYVDIYNNPVQSDTLIGDDFTSNDLYPQGESVTITAPSISGYQTQSPLSQTITAAPNAEVTFTYKSASTSPNINVGDHIINKNATVDETVLRSWVTATSSVDGTSIPSSSITVSPTSLDTSIETTYTVTYTATDSYGNLGVKSISVKVVDGDPSNQYIPYADGSMSNWQYKDFTYNTGTITFSVTKYGGGTYSVTVPNAHAVTGLSASGMTKYTAGMSLVLPGFNPANGKAITAITNTGNNESGPAGTAFNNLNFSVIDLSNMADLEIIYSQAFSKNADNTGSAVTTINFGNPGARLTKLKAIGDHAFRNFRGTSLDLSDLTSLQIIGNFSFSDSSSGVSGRNLTDLKMNNLPSLIAIGDYDGTGGRTFINSPITSFDFTQMPNLEQLGVAVFCFSQPTTVDLRPLTKLIVLGSHNFREAPTTTFYLQDLYELKYLGANIFDRSLLTHLELINLPKLETILTNVTGSTNTNPNIKWLTIDNVGVTNFNKAFNLLKLTKLEIKNCQNLTSLEVDAFRNALITEVTLENLPLLETIDENSFYYSPITDLTLKDLPSLRVIGRYAFRRFAGTQLILKDLPSLEILGSFAFSDATNDIGGSNLTDLQLINLPSLRVIGAKYIYSGAPVGEEGAGGRTFANAKLTSIDFSGTPNLEQIGYGAFYSSPLSYLDFTGLNQLEFIGAVSFANFVGDTLVISDLPELEEIGSQAFTPYGQTSYVKTVELSNLPKLKYLYDSAIDYASGSGLYNFSPFYMMYGVTSMTLDNLPSLEVLTPYFCAHCPLTELVMDDLDNLKTIDIKAFAMSKLTSLDLSNLTALESIGWHAFRDAKITELNLTSLTNLKTIGAEAFRDTQIEVLDLSDSINFLGFPNYYETATGITFKSAFGSSSNATGTGSALRYVLIGGIGAENTSDTLYLENDSAMSDANQTFNKNDNVYVYILGDAGNVVTQHGYLLNPVNVKIQYHYTDPSNNTVDLLEERVILVERDANGDATFVPPSIFGYIAPPAQTIHIDMPAASDLGDPNVLAATVVFDYALNDTQGNMYAAYHIEEHGVTTTGLIGSTLTTDLKLDNGGLSADQQIGAGWTVEILYDPTRVQFDSASTHAAYTVTDDPMAGVVTLHFTQTLPSGSFSPTLFWKLIPGPTEQRRPFPLYVTLINPSGIPVATADPVVTLSGTYNKPKITKWVETAEQKTPTQSDNSTLPGGTFVNGAYVNENRLWAEYTFTLTQVYRNLSEITYTDILPYYIKNVNGVPTTVQVSLNDGFDPDKNPGWVYIPEVQAQAAYCDTTPVADCDPYDADYHPAVPYAPAKVSITYQANGMMVNTPVLYLEFPGAWEDQVITNQISFESKVDTPLYGDAVTFTGSDSISLILSGMQPGNMIKRMVTPHYSADVDLADGYVVLNPDGEPIVVSDGQVLMDYTGWFYDSLTEKSAEMSWQISVSGKNADGEDLPQSSYYKDFSFTDSMLDSRMQYTGVDPVDFKPVTVTAYDVNGNVLFTQSNVTSKITFPAAIQAQIAKITMTGSPKRITSGQEGKVLIYTKLKDPSLTYEELTQNGTSSGHYDPDTNTAEDYFWNLGEVERTLVTAENLSGFVDHTSSWGSARIHNLVEGVGISKTPSDTDGTYLAGQALDYSLTIDVYDGVVKLKDAAVADMILEDVVIRDVLPYAYIYENFTPSSALLSATTNLQYRFIDSGYVSPYYTLKSWCQMDPGNCSGDGSDSDPYVEIVAMPSEDDWCYLSGVQCLDMVEITADTLEVQLLGAKNNGLIGTVQGIISPLAGAQTVRNVIFLDFAENPSIAKGGPTTDNSPYPVFDENDEFVDYKADVLYGDTQGETGVTKVLVGAKFIRNCQSGSGSSCDAWGNWQTTLQDSEMAGVTTGGQPDDWAFLYQYKLVVTNNTDRSEQENNFYLVDVLPFVGDLGIVPGETGTQGARYSQFKDKLIDIKVLDPEAANKYKIYYLVSNQEMPAITTDYAGSDMTAAPNGIIDGVDVEYWFEHLPAGYSWVLQSSYTGDMSDVIGFKVQGDPTVILKEDQSLEVLVTMQAPKDVPVGYRAINSFAWKCNVQKVLLEAPPVYNEIAEFPQAIEFIKVDAANHSLKLAGAVFELYDSSNTLLARVTSGSDGLVGFYNLYSGTYTVKEVKAPDGYSLPSTTTYQVLVKANNVTEVYTLRDDGVPVGQSASGQTVVRVEVANTKIPPAKQKIEFYKVNAAGDRLYGATFELWYQNTRIATQTSNTLGLVSFTNIESCGAATCTYTVKEITAASGYVLPSPNTWNVVIPTSTTAMTYTLRLDGKAIGELDQEGNVVVRSNVVNEPGPLSITLLKLGVPGAEAGQNDAATMPSAGKVLAGAVFELYDENDNLLQTVTTGSDGRAMLGGALVTLAVDTPYYVLETTVPVNYDITYQSPSQADVPVAIWFRIHQDNKVYKINDIDDPSQDELYQSGYLLVKNYPQEEPASIQIVKTSVSASATNPLAGITFYLEKLDPATNTYTRIDSVVTDADGKAAFTNLFSGTYKVHEAKQSEAGYVPGYLTASDKIYVITAGTVAQTITYEVKNYDTQPILIKGDLVGTYNPNSPLELAKLLAVEQSLIDQGYIPKRILRSDGRIDLVAGLSGAAFTINEYAGSSTSGTPLNTWHVTSGSDGSVDLSGIVFDENNTYVIIETASPQGYSLNTAKLIYQPKYESATYLALGTKWLSYTDTVIKHKIVISKYAGDTGAPLAGARFGLYYPDGTPIDETLISNANGVIEIKDVAPGTYYLKELASPSPKYGVWPGYFKVVITGNTDITETEPILYDDDIGTDPDTVIHQSVTSGTDASLIVNDPRKYELSGLVWVDYNLDGIRDSGEPLVKDVTVTLYEGDGVTIAKDVFGNTVSSQATTDTLSDGHTYVFDNLPAGDYIVKFSDGDTDLGEYKITKTDAGADDAKDNDAIGTYHNTSDYTDTSNGAYTSDELVGATITDINLPRDITSDGYKSEHHDLGLWQPRSVSGLVWLDKDRDGIRDDDEELISGVKVELYKYDDTSSSWVLVSADKDGNPFGTVETDSVISDGHTYLFDNLTDGKYYVKFSDGTTDIGGYEVTLTLNLPQFEGVDSDAKGTVDTNGTPTLEDDELLYADTLSNTNHDITLSQTNPKSEHNDLGLYRPYILSGLVFDDYDRDGIQDEGEPFIDGVKVSLYVLDEDNSSATYGQYIPAVDESGVLVPSQYTDSSTIDPDDDETRFSYCFTALPEGKYRVVFEEGPDLLFGNSSLTLKDSGSDDTRDSDGDDTSSGTSFSEATIDGSSHTTLGPDNQHSPYNDIGICRLFEISGVVWEDENRDGFRDPSETILGGVTVTLYVLDEDDTSLTYGQYVLVSVDGKGNPVTPLTTASTITDEHTYVFGDLPHGTYKVVFSDGSLDLGQYSITKSDASDNGSAVNDDYLDSDVTSSHTTLDGNHDLDTGWIEDINLPRDITSSGYKSEHHDLGLVKSYKLSGIVWLDENNDGQRQADEELVDGVKVTLRVLDEDPSSLTYGEFIPATDTQGNPVASQVIDLENSYDGSDGISYLFDNLPEGKYQVIFSDINDETLGITKQDIGNDNSDSDAGEIPDGTNTIIAIGSADSDAVVLDDTLSDRHSPHHDLGLVKQYTISGLVWNDRNNNGLHEESELLIGGVTVSLKVLDEDENSPTYLNYIPAVDIHGDLVISQLTDPLRYDSEDSPYTYLFEHLPQGVYQVTFSDPAGNILSEYGVTKQDVDNNTHPNQDSDGESLDPNGCDASQGAIINGIGKSDNPLNSIHNDLGVVKAYNLSGLVWEDINVNGLRDGDEVILEGVKVTLEVWDEDTQSFIPALHTDGSTVIEEFTDLSLYDPNDGSYTYIFKQLPEGTYKVTFLDPDDDTILGNYISTMMNEGDDDFDSDGVGNDDEFTALSEADILDLYLDHDLFHNDLGLIPSYELSGLVWLDDNRNGLQDQGEQLLNGVTVTLLVYDSASGSYVPAVDVYGNPVSPVLTNTALYNSTPGLQYTYRFAKLPKGDYKVLFTDGSVRLGEYIVTLDNALSNTQDNADSDAIYDSDMVLSVNGLTLNQYQPKLVHIDLGLYRRTTPSNPGTTVTGVNNSLTIWVVLLTSAGLLLGIWGYLKKRKREKEKK